MARGERDRIADLLKPATDWSPWERGDMGEARRVSGSRTSQSKRIHAYENDGRAD